MTIPLPHPIAQSSIFQLSVVSLVTLIISIFLNVLLLLFLDVFLYFRYSLLASYSER